MALTKTYVLNCKQEAIVSHFDYDLNGPHRKSYCHDFLYVKRFWRYCLHIIEYWIYSKNGGGRKVATIKRHTGNDIPCTVNRLYVPKNINVGKKYHKKRYAH